MAEKREKVEKGTEMVRGFIGRFLQRYVREWAALV